jgi:hypothetical protein
MAETDQTAAPSPRELKALIEAERTGNPFVNWRDGEGGQRILMLPADRARVTIGRREHSDIPLTWDSEVSRAHAILEPVGEAWTLVDDGLSRNGSFVNGSRVRGRQRLHDRDRMCFGNTHVVFREPSSGRGSESTARAPGSPVSAQLPEMQRKVLIALCRPVVGIELCHPCDQSADRGRGVLERRCGQSPSETLVRALRAKRPAAE